MKNNLIKAILIANLFLFNLISNAQNQTFSCGTDVLINKALKTKIGQKNNSDQNIFFNKFINTQYLPKKGKTNQIYYIPTVVHVVHDYGPENIPDANIHNMITNTNIELRKNNPDSSLIQFPFNLIHPDLEIEYGQVIRIICKSYTEKESEDGKDD